MKLIILDTPGHESAMNDIIAEKAKNGCFFLNGIEVIEQHVEAIQESFSNLSDSARNAVIEIEIQPKCLTDFRKAKPTKYAKHQKRLRERRGARHY